MIPLSAPIHQHVQRIADGHLTASPGAKVAHTEPVVGCPWCITDVREEAAAEVLRSLNADDWHLMSAHTVRYMLAADDLRARGAL